MPRTAAFLEPAELQPDRPAIHDGGAGLWLRQGALRQAASELALRLSPGRGGLAFLFCRNDVTTVIAYLACLDARVAVALLDANLGVGPRRALADTYRPEVVLCGGDGPPLDGYAAADVPHAPAWFRRGPPGPAVHPELALLLSTSGSTGSPKLVRLTRRNVEANAASIVRCLGILPDQRAVGSLPLHYSYGLSVLNSHLLAGASVVLTEQSVLSPGFWELARVQACTTFQGVPSTYAMLARAGLERLAPRSLHTMTQAGGKLGEELVRRFHAFMSARGGRFFAMYGQTEATARIACVPAERLAEKLGSAGCAIPGGALQIALEDGTPTREPGRAGEVVYEGPNVMMGYAVSREDLGRGDDLGGRLATGDLGHLDADGFLFITGRSKRIAKVFGIRVNLDEIDGRLRHLGPTAAVAREDSVHLFCEWGDDAAFAELRRSLAADLRLHHAAFVFHRVDALPLTANGKIDYGRLEGA